MQKAVTPPRYPSASRLTVIWLVLLVATAATWSMGEMGSTGGASGIGGGWTSVLLLLAIAFIKSHLVARDFMGFKDASLLWRGLMLGWLVLVLGLIAIAFYHAG